MYFRLERVQKYVRDLKGYIYEKTELINNIKFKKGFYKDIKAVEDSPLLWENYQTDDYWGGKNCDQWFRFTVKVPESYANKPVALYLSTGLESVCNFANPQFLIYVDGSIVQGLDANHREVLLTNVAEGNEYFHIDLKAHSGTNESKVDLHIELVCIDKKTKELFYNLSVPLQAAQALEEHDDRKTAILEILNDTLNILDLRRPHSTEYMTSVELANQFISQNFYEKQCGKEENVASVIGHTHIDVAWLWTLDQTMGKVARSFSTVLQLMDEYPEYKFMSSQPQLYQYLKEDHPKLYEKVKIRIAEGRWEAEGACG